MSNDNPLYKTHMINNNTNNKLLKTTNKLLNKTLNKLKQNLRICKRISLALLAVKLSNKKKDSPTLTGTKLISALLLHRETSSNQQLEFTLETITLDNRKTYLTKKTQIKTDSRKRTSTPCLSK